MRFKHMAILLAGAALASCASSPSESSEDSSFVSEEVSEAKAKDLFFPTDVDDPSSSSGIDVFLGEDPYRLTGIYVGEGVEEEITSYTFNEKYCTIDSLGRITPKSPGSTLCYAVTKRGKYPFKVNVKERSSYREWMRDSSAELIEKHNQRGDKTNEIVFFGDSFFDPRGFWDEGNFYSAFAGKDVFLTGIGTAKTNDWMTIRKENLLSYSPKAAFINLGVNNIINAGDNGKTLAAKLITLFEELHYQKADMPLFYYGIIDSMEPSWNEKAKVSNAIVEEYASTRDWLTYLDIPSLVNGSIRSYLKDDGLHPNSACYEKFAELAKEHM